MKRYGILFIMLATLSFGGCNTIQDGLSAISDFFYDVQQGVETGWYDVWRTEVRAGNEFPEIYISDIQIQMHEGYPKDVNNDQYPDYAFDFRRRDGSTGVFSEVSYRNEN
jgi:hypothetical protein